MTRTIRLLATFGGGAILVSFAVLVVNQTAQVVQLATTFHPSLGTFTLYGLVTTYAVLVGVPVVLVLRLPSPVSPPTSDQGPEFDLHLRRLGRRIAPNPHLAGLDLSDRRGIENALRLLDEKALAIARESASGVFLATAVSQSGRLDGLVVLAAQSRMIWRIAHVYHQRPTLRDMVHLYTNVAGTAFVAGELQEIDLGEQVEPILSSAVGALGGERAGVSRCRDDPGQLRPERQRQRLPDPASRHDRPAILRGARNPAQILCAEGGDDRGGPAPRRDRR